MADISTATSYQLSDLTKKAAPDASDLLLIEDENGVAYVIDASSIAISAEGVANAVNSWLAAHPEATTTIADGAVTTIKLADGAVTMTKLGSNVRSAFALLSESVAEKVNAPLSSPGVQDYGTAGQVLMTNGDGTTAWGDMQMTDTEAANLLAVAEGGA